MMGESSACLVRSFSTPAESTCYEGNPIVALGESISFGRFMTEGLDWEKWSIFSHNRYVEEAEKYSKPGSVAAKKAYFEAHYKRKAAERAAALIQEANAEANGTFESEALQGNCTDSSSEMSSTVANAVAVNEQPDEETVNCRVVECADRDQHKCDAGQSDLDITNVEGAENVPHPCIDTGLNVESCSLVDNSNSNQFHHVEDNTDIAVPAEEVTFDHGTAGEEDLALPVEGREVNSSPKLSTKTLAARHSHSLVERRKAAADVPPRSGINSGPKGKKFVGNSVEKKRQTALSLRMSISFPSGTGETRKRTAAVSQTRNGLNNFSTTKKTAGGSAEKKRITAPSLYMSTNLQSGAGMTSKTDTAATKPRNGINIAAKSTKSVKGSAEKRPITRSLHMSINLPSGAGETSKTETMFEQKRIRKIHSKLPKDNPVALRTSTEASHGVLNQASANPPSQGRSTERPLNKSVSGGVTTNAKPSSSISFGCLKSSSTTKSNLQSATISSPFRFRSEERAVKRKEFLQRMDETKSKEEEKVKLQRTLKISLTLPQSPKFGRKACSNSSTVKVKSLGNSWKPPINTNNSKTEKNNRTRQTVTSLSNTTRENASPNIQH